LTDPELAALIDLTPEQRAVLKTMAEIGVPVDSSKLRQAAERGYAVSLNEKNFPKVLNPLAAAGFLTFKAAGGKSAPVTPLPRLLKDVTIPLIDQYGKGLPSKLRSLLTQPLPEIVKELDSTSGYTKGLALEALGVKIMRSVGLDYRETRFRPQSGGRFEVDLLFDSQRLAYSRWQIQCKNTSSVDLDDVAKEVGLVYRLLSNVIVVLTRGRIGNEARRYAVDVMLKTSLAIVLIDGHDVKQILADPLVIYDVLEREAAFAMSVKPLEAAATPSTALP
jgi:site-specific DNA-methyltransferase (cytosine-N4-specific)